MSALPRNANPALSIVSNVSVNADPLSKHAEASHVVVHMPAPEATPATPQYSKHPVAAALELPRGNGYEALRENIAEHGLKTPVLLCDGQVLDGWDRLQACIDAKCEPHFEIYQGHAPLTEFLRLNLQRRHLTVGQQAALVFLAADPDLQAKHGGARSQAATLQLVTIAAQSRAFGVGERTLATARRVGLESRAMLKRVLRGELSLEAAEAELFPKKPGATATQNDPHETCRSDLDALQIKNAKIAAAYAEAIAQVATLRLRTTLLEDAVAARDVRIAQLVSSYADLKRSFDRTQDHSGPQVISAPAAVVDSPQTAANPASDADYMRTLGDFESLSPAGSGAADEASTQRGDS